MWFDCVLGAKAVNADIFGGGVHHGHGGHQCGCGQRAARPGFHLRSRLHLGTGQRIGEGQCLRARQAA